MGASQQRDFKVLDTVEETQGCTRATPKLKPQEISAKYYMHDFLDPSSKKTYSCRVPYVEISKKTAPKNDEDSTETISDLLAPLLSTCIYKVR